MNSLASPVIIAITSFVVALTGCSSKPTPRPQQSVVASPPSPTQEARSFLTQALRPCNDYDHNGYVRITSVEFTSSILKLDMSSSYVDAYEIPLNSVTARIAGDGEIEFVCTIPGCIREYAGIHRRVTSERRIYARPSSLKLSRCDEPARLVNALKYIIDRTPQVKSTF